jgi:hypothetical protein
MKNKYLGLIALTIVITLLASACKKNSTKNPKLIFKFQIDSMQQRLDNLGNPSTIPSGHSAQTPVFNTLSAHYLELAPSSLTALGTGTILYRAEETTLGGTNAIDFDKNKKVKNGEEFYSVALADVKPGTYEWMRLSLAYQNYDITYKYKNPIDTTQNLIGKGTVASFVGFNTYINSVLVNTQSLAVNANKVQGFWAFETFGYLFSGQAPAGATTVPNPLFASSPIPAGSCVVTGKFTSAPLTITGNEEDDIVVTIKVSNNKSFEWTDLNGDGYYQPDKGDVPTDMGLRGIVPVVE